MTKEPMHFQVNGVEVPLPGGLSVTDGSFGELLLQIRSQYDSREACISSIRVDGRELTENEEMAFTLLPLTEVTSVEIWTSHPREVAEETLQNLLPFTDHLERLSLDAANCFRGHGHPSRDLAKLMDGIEIFLEALNNVRQILRVGALPAIDILEADLASIMKDLLEFYQRGETAYVAELLGEHMTRNMQEWRTEGLPALIRSRDS